jgi:MFS transporter, DHA2 family, methylenomycin A resistance protein
VFGSLVGQSGAFMAGLHASLIVSAGVLLAAAAAIWWGASTDIAGHGQS